VDREIYSDEIAEGRTGSWAGERKPPVKFQPKVLAVLASPPHLSAVPVLRKLSLPVNANSVSALFIMMQMPVSVESRKRILFPERVVALRVWPSAMKF